MTLVKAGGQTENGVAAPLVSAAEVRGPKWAIWELTGGLGIGPAPPLYRHAQPQFRLLHPQHRLKQQQLKLATVNRTGRKRSCVRLCGYIKLASTDLSANQTNINQGDIQKSLTRMWFKLQTHPEAELFNRLFRLSCLIEPTLDRRFGVTVIDSEKQPSLRDFLKTTLCTTV